ncbi:MAG: hypothetical protein R3346_04430 [Candidatus Spechtbacterales bacterium]|nr:hypothetical protein [Candidatus Spechtbacterales bacterium]
MNKELQKYIKDMHEAGYTDADIWKKLKEAGWSIEDISEELKEVKGDYNTKKPNTDSE